jgi:hypothetical protein
MPDLTATRPFNIGAILSITGEAMMCDIGDIYDLLGWMTGESLMTHQLPRASRECEGFLRETFPDLANVDVPTWTEMPGWDRLDNDGKMRVITAWLDAVPGDASREVPRLPAEDHTHIDPLTELTMMRPDLPIIAVDLTGDGQ